LRGPAIVPVPFHFGGPHAINFDAQPIMSDRICTLPDVH